MIRVLIVDDQALIRAAVRQILVADAELEVIADAVNGDDAIRAARQWKPDVILMDIRMPVIDGIEATAMICADPSLHQTRVLILTTFEDDDNVVSALRAGASGFVGKGAEPDDLVHAVHAIHAGEALLSPSATRSLIAKYLIASVPGPTAARLSLTEPLTPREAETLTLVARGLSNDEIAAEFVISPHTAKTHVNRIMAKLGAHDRAQLVVWAYETGFINPPNL